SDFNKQAQTFRIHIPTTPLLQHHALGTYTTMTDHNNDTQFQAICSVKLADYTNALSISTEI
uniref:hypothetical protein n=1 Tax=Photobacterium sanctipauli TaxID=1342794 RepID=UPI001C1E81DD